MHHEAKFEEVSLNVVLQEGVNDSDEGLDALVKWCRPEWRITLNGLLTDQGSRIAPRTARFAEGLRAHGINVSVFSTVAREVERLAIYPQLATQQKSRTQLDAA